MSDQVSPPGPAEPAESGETDVAARAEPAPEIKPSAAAPAETAPAPAPLSPGRGAPLVEGPAASVSGPIGARNINLFFGIGAVVLIIATIMVVILLAYLVLSVAGRH